jgi:hypothetical protein
MAGFGEFFKEGSTAEQFLIWGVLMQVLQPLLLPFTAELQKLVLSAAPDLPIDTGSAAAGVARGFLDNGTGQDKANDNGIGEHDFTLLTKLAKHAPDLSAAFELHRRGEIPTGGHDPEQVSLRGVMTDAGIPAEWHDELAKLAELWPTSSEVYDAWLQGQVTPGYAKELLGKLGVPDWWVQHGYDTRGQAPTPTQALELLNRKIIPKYGTGPGSVSYQQAFLEGPWRNKWLDPFLALAEYLPPPRTVTAMYHDGQLDHATAAELLRKQGLSATLADAYLSKASSTHTVAEKHLAKGEITKAYADGLMSRKQASQALADLKYQPADVKVILDLVDVHTKTSQLNSASNRVRAQYETGKLSDAEAEHLLHQLGIDAAQAKGMVAIWRLTVTHRTRTLSPGQIESAWYYGIIDARSAITLLMALGYDEFDAWTALSVRNKGPIKDVPRPSSPWPAPKPLPPTTPGV